MIHVLLKRWRHAPRILVHTNPHCANYKHFAATLSFRYLDKFLLIINTILQGKSYTGSTYEKRSRIRIVRVLE